MQRREGHFKFLSMNFMFSTSSLIWQTLQGFQKCNYDNMVHKNFMVKMRKQNFKFITFFILTSINYRYQIILQTILVPNYIWYKTWSWECWEYKGDVSFYLFVVIWILWEFDIKISFFYISKLITRLLQCWWLMIMPSLEVWVRTHTKR